jgi:hypothetical protein
MADVKYEALGDGDLTPEQLDGMDLWDRDVMLDERHRAVGALLVRRAIAEIRRRRAQETCTPDATVVHTYRCPVHGAFSALVSSSSLSDLRWRSIASKAPDHVACGSIVKLSDGLKLDIARCGRLSPWDAMEVVAQNAKGAGSEFLTGIRNRAQEADPDVVRDLGAQLDAARAEVSRLTLLINTPRTDEFFEAVRIESAHQIERWGVEHDAGKRSEDWVTLMIYLLGKAARAHFDGDQPKLEHHVVTSAAVALNWWRHLTGVSTAMRPGVEPGADDDDPGPCTPTAHCWARGSAVCQCGRSTRDGDCHGWKVASRLTDEQIHDAITGKPRDMRPSIADLQRIEREMIPGDWWTSDEDGGVCAGEPGPSAVEVGAVDWKGEDQYGAITLRNAAPVLLGIAAAALDFALMQETSDPGKFAQKEFDVLWNAIAKVRQ